MMKKEPAIDTSVCKHFHIFYCTDKNKMCDIHGECKPFTEKLCTQCDDYCEEVTESPVEN